MTKFKFRNPETVEDTLLTSLDTKLIIPNDHKADPDEVTYFANGDRLTINMRTGEGIYDPVNAGSMCNSRISMKFHQWFGKGIIIEVAAA